MHRYLEVSIRKDLQKKMVLLAGPRQVGKTILGRNLERNLKNGATVEEEAFQERTVVADRVWPQRAELLILIQLQKVPDWVSWLKGVIDGRSKTIGMNDRMLVTGSARMEAFRQAGKSWVGRYYLWRLHPISVREWCETSNATPEQALMHLMERSGFPAPVLALSHEEAEHWRSEHFSYVMHEDVIDASGLHEEKAMRSFVQILRERVGTPLSLAAIAHEVGVAPSTITRYLGILESQYFVFTVRPWSKDIARATLHQPKVYFFDVGLVLGDASAQFENFVAYHLLKNVHWQQDAKGQNVDLHYIRTKDDAQVDFSLSDATGAEPKLTHLIECKLSDAKPHGALKRFSHEHPDAVAVQLVRDLEEEQKIGSLHIRHAAKWLAELEV